MIILGVDPGLASTGWGIVSVSNRKMQALGWGVIRTEAGHEHGQRLVQIYDSVYELIQKYQVQYAALENVFFARNVSSAIPVSEAKGVILMLLAQKHIASYEYSPRFIKQAITGSGAASKEDMQRLVKLLLSLADIPKPDHAADALGAAICLYHHEGGRFVP